MSLVVYLFCLPLISNLTSGRILKRHNRAAPVKSLVISELELLFLNPV